MRTSYNAVDPHIGLGHSNSPLVCPVLSTVSQFLHFHVHNTSAPTPLATYYHTTQGCTTHHFITPFDITLSLHLSISALGMGIGLLPNNITS